MELEEVECGSGNSRRKRVRERERERERDGVNRIWVRVSLIEVVGMCGGGYCMCLSFQ